MKSRPLLITLLIATVINLAYGQQDPQPSDLFEEGGTDWIRGGEAKWKFIDKELIGTASGGSGFVMTKERYKDFELTLEFFPDSTVNSGVFVRCAKVDISNIECYEMNIWDLHPDQKSRTGSIVSRAVPQAHVETLGKWNTYKITCKGNRIKTWVNDMLTVDIEDKDLREGYIGLQAAETGRIKFRNVRLQLIREH